METSKLTISDKTYDLSLLNRTKRTNLRRKAIIEYIQSKPSGELINISDFQRVAQFKAYATTYSFLKRMVNNGVIGQYKGDKPRTYYYSVLGAVRVKRPKTAEGGVQPSQTTAKLPDINAFIRDMKALGVKFTITIEGK